MANNEAVYPMPLQLAMSQQQAFAPGFCATENSGPSSM
jgi:hypothetical protein